MIRTLRSAVSSASAWLMASGVLIGFAGWEAIYRFQVGPIRRPGLWLAAAAAAVALAAFLAAAIASSPPFRGLKGFTEWARARPHRCIAACALLAVVASWYPVVFGGRSIAGTGYGRIGIVYDTDAALPGLPAASSPNQGADIGVLPWALIPNQFIVQRAVLRDHEWPFWNRYSYSGTMLLGQMQSNFGDPLQAFVWLAGGGAWGWDCKYIAAKFLFCLCAGLIAYRCTKSLSAAVFTAVSNAFLGAFMRTFSHPEFFVLTSAPVILLCAAMALESGGWRRLGWALAWGASCMTAVHSGAVKGGAIECCTMTALGWTYVLFRCPDRRARWRTLALGACLALGWVAINLPLLWPFILFREDVYHGANIATSTQPVHQLLGLFDFFFYRDFPGYGTPLPPATLVHLPLAILGIFAIVSRRGQTAGRLLLLFSVLAGAVAFGAVPGVWIDGIPVLNRVGHLDRQIGYQLAGVCLPLLAAFGWCFAGRAASRGYFGRSYLLMLSIAIALAAWQAAQASAPPWTSSWKGYAWVATLAAFIAPFFLFAGKRLPRVSPAAAVLAFLMAASPAFARNVFIHDYRWDSFFMVPGPRPDLRRTSPALDQLIEINRAQAAPGRTMGTRYAIFGNYGATWGFEDIRGNNPMVSHAYERWIDRSGMIVLPRVANWVIGVTDFENARPLLNVLDVRLLASMPYFGEPRGYSTLYRGDLILSENRAAWPRAFFAPGALAADDFDEFWTLARRFADTPFISLSRDVLRAQRAAPLAQPSAIVPARDYRLTSSRTEFTVDAPGPGWVFLGETHWPGHARASLNGVPVGVETADGVLQAVRLAKAGSYRIVFHYIPDGWEYAAGIGLAGIGALAAWVILLFRRTD
ncbi:MAG: hypothetical protein ABSA05_12765 [Opitutaceae bacterium]